MKWKPLFAVLLGLLIVGYTNEAIAGIISGVANEWVKSPALGG